MKIISAFLILVLLFTSISYAATVPSNEALISITLLNYDPSPAEAGKYFDLFVNIENIGSNDAPDLECELQPEFPFSLDPNQDAVRSVGVLPGKETALFEYKVRVASTAVDGDNELRIRCSKNGVGSGTYVNKDLDISVESNNAELVIGLITSVPDDLKADQDDVELTIEIQNIGEGDAKLVIAELILSDEFEASNSFSDSYSLGTISADDSAEAVFYIDINDDVESGKHPTKLKLKYKDDNNNQNEFIEKELDFNINIKPSPTFKIEELKAGTNTASENFNGYIYQNGEIVSPSDLQQGGVGELRIKIVNTGEKKAESVSVKVFEDSENIPLDFDEIFDYIGNLEPGQSGYAVFGFTIDEDAVLKEYLIETEIRFVDGSDVDTEIFTIPVEVAKQGAGNSFLYVVALIIIIIVVIVIWKRRKKKKR
ncbi:COG1361 S-layer family protein [Candidatus Aenigmatarchaeota archaeon]